MTYLQQCTPHILLKFSFLFYIFQELQELAKVHQNVKILSLGITRIINKLLLIRLINLLFLDVTDFGSYPELAKEIESFVGENGINLLINNAGYSSKFTRLDYVKAEQMEKTFLINVVAPVLLAKEFKPLLKKATSPSQSSWVVNISSILGSIDANKEGGFYPYRASKAALNACTKSMAIDLRTDNIHALSLHPGWVKTDMGGSNAPLKVEQSCSNMVQLMENLEVNQSGKFLQHDGKELPW